MARFLKYRRSLYNLDMTTESHCNENRIWLGWPNTVSTSLHFTDSDEAEEAFEFITNEYLDTTQIIDLNKWVTDRKEAARRKAWEENDESTEEA